MNGDGSLVFSINDLTAKNAWGAKGDRLRLRKVENESGGEIPFLNPPRDAGEERFS
jgi:hypothetical protein